MESLVHSVFLDILSTLVFRGRKLGDEDLAFLQHFCKWRHALNAASKSVRRKTNIFKFYLTQNVLTRIPHTVLSRFRFSEHLEKEWFTEEVPLPQEKSTKRQIKMLNLREKPKNQDNPLITKFMSTLVEDGYRIFFHATCHSSAEDIIRNGIRINKPDDDFRRVDFSIGKGFYLNDRYKGEHGALNWAFSHFFHKLPAIVIFKIPEREVDTYREQAASILGSHDFDLGEIVKVCRTGNLGNKRRQKELERMLRDLPVLEGPMYRVRDEYFVSEVSESYQICLLKEEVAECFDKHLHSAIFF